ncbi:MAG: RagB/SusD family nutrient uptake outer membrane protein [Candidatus Symbiothrix sp.]|jgi:hypothetical protein|nr:RagB/SusD family nutrient uptake outer membrane protein [Candidatus Symbiothrix sp.]
MKHIIKIKYAAICLLAGMLLNSCSDYLDVVPDNVATLDHAFSDRYTTERFLATCYWALPKSSGWNENPALVGAYGLMFNSFSKNQKGMVAMTGVDQVTDPLFNYWASTGDSPRSLYAGIRDCNTFIERVEGVKDLTRENKDRLIAEVKVIKAYLHFYLLTYYGPISLLKENNTVNEDTRGVRVYREKVDDCFAYVLELLDEAIASPSFPRIIENRSTELGRFSKSAALAIKAKALVYWASPLFNGNRDYNSFLDHNNEPFFNQVEDPSRWTKAAAACKEAVESCGGSYRLYEKTDFVSTKPTSDFTLLVNTLRSSVSERWNPEILWGTVSKPIGTDFQSLALPSLANMDLTMGYLYYQGTMGVPLNVAELFYSKNGIPIEEDASYDYAGRYNIRVGDEENKYCIQKGERTAALHFDREPRFYATLGFDRGKWYGNYFNLPDDDVNCNHLKGRYREYSSPVPSTQEYNATGYWPKKLVSMGTSFRDAIAVSYQTYPFPEMRFADLLLLTAEAINESTGPSEEVYQYIDRVRERAGLEGVVESYRNHANQDLKEKPSSKAGLRDIIRRERKIELALEGQHYWDTRRWKTAPQELNVLIRGWNVMATGVDDYYSVTTLFTPEFTLKNYFAPIPESDIIKNPQLVQNPGW